MTITNVNLTSTAPISGWSQDPRFVTQQVTHAVEPGHLIALCGVRIAHTGAAWSQFTPLARCHICRTVVVQMGDPDEPPSAGRNA